MLFGGPTTAVDETTVATIQDNEREPMTVCCMLYAEEVSEFIMVFCEIFPVIGGLASDKHVPVLQYLLFS